MTGPNPDSLPSGDHRADHPTGSARETVEAGAPPPSPGRLCARSDGGSGAGDGIRTRDILSPVPGLAGGSRGRGSSLQWPPSPSASRALRASLREDEAEQGPPSPEQDQHHERVVELWLGRVAAPDGDERPEANEYTGDPSLLCQQIDVLQVAPPPAVTQSSAYEGECRSPLRPPPRGIGREQGAGRPSLGWPGPPGLSIGSGGLPPDSGASTPSRRPAARDWTQVAGRVGPAPPAWATSMHARRSGAPR